MANNIFLVFLGILFALQCVNGLRCYECASNTEIAEEYDIPHNSNCKEGGLPDSHAVECSIYNLRNKKTLKQLTTEEIQLKKKQFPDLNITWMCSKFQGKLEGVEVTFKGCDEHAYYDEPRDEVDQCRGLNEEGLSGTICQCFKDLCNSAPQRGQLIGMVTAICVILMTTAITVFIY